MTVTDIHHTSKKKVQVSLDGEPAFTISIQEFMTLGLEVNQTLNQTQWEQLEQAIGRISARTAMNMLMQKDYTTAELTGKLQKKGFSTWFAEIGVHYVAHYHYIDDERYVQHYIASHKDLMSRQMMLYKLKQKGLAESMIQLALETADWSDEASLFREIQKYIGRESKLSDASDKTKQKMIQSLLRKGYRFHDIRSAISEFDNHLQL